MKNDFYLIVTNDLGRSIVMIIGANPLENMNGMLIDIFELLRKKWEDK